VGEDLVDDRRFCDICDDVQGSATQGAAQFSRLEGNRRRGRQIYFPSMQGREGASSNFGPGFGQIGPEENLPALRLLENIAISPRGTLLLCEDGTVSNDDPPIEITSKFMRGFTKNGQLFDFAQNVNSTGEFTGAIFSPDGKRLSFNVQDTGRTFDVGGPFEQGPVLTE
jgi:hypothetical protein